MLIEAKLDPGPVNPPKVDDLDYIHFLIAAQKVFTCTEAARSQPESDEQAPAHDAFTRLLQRRPPETEALWQEAESFVDRSDGLLILDDTTLDKPYAKEIEHVTWHWSGKHNDTVKGINLLTLLWGGPTEQEEDPPSGEEEEAPKEAHLPCDFRLYNKDEDGLTKNDHFRQRLEMASKRGFEPVYVVFDSWYSGLDNLKKIRSQEWLFFTRLKSNRQVNPDDTGNRAVREVEIPEEGRLVHLKGFGFVKVFRTGSKSGDAEDGDAKYGATNDLGMTEDKREELARRAWGVETYHRQLGAATAGRNARSTRARRPSTTMCSCRSVRFCDWKCIGSKRRSVFIGRKRRLSGKPYELIWPIRPTFSLQVRKS